MAHNEPVEICRVQPHNLALARKSLDYLSYFAQPYCQRTCGSRDSASLDRLASDALAKTGEKNGLADIDYQHGPDLKRLDALIRKTDSVEDARFYSAYRFFKAKPVHLLKVSGDGFLSLDGDHRLFVFNSLGNTHYPHAVQYDLNRESDLIQMALFVNERMKDHLRREGISDAIINQFFTDPEEYASPEYIASLATMASFVRDVPRIRTYDDMRGKILQTTDDIKMVFDEHYGNYRRKRLESAQK